MECYSCPLIQWDFYVESWAHMISTLVVLHAESIISFHLWWRMLYKVLFEFEERASYFGSLRAGLVIAPLSVPKMSLSPQWTDTRCSSFKPPHYTTSEHAPKRYWTWKTFACKTTDSWPKAPSIESHRINLLEQEEDNKNQHFTSQRAEVWHSEGEA